MSRAAGHPPLSWSTVRSLPSQMSQARCVADLDRETLTGRGRIEVDPDAAPPRSPKGTAWVGDFPAAVGLPAAGAGDRQGELTQDPNGTPRLFHRAPMNLRRGLAHMGSRTFARRLGSFGCCGTMSFPKSLPDCVRELGSRGAASGDIESGGHERRTSRQVPFGSAPPGSPPWG